MKAADAAGASGAAREEDRAPALNENDERQRQKAREKAEEEANTAPLPDKVDSYGHLT